RVPVGLAGIDDLGGRDRDSRFDREPDALLPARGDHRPDDAAGEVLGHVPLSDLLAARDARRLACAVVAGPDGTLRARQDRPRRPAMTLDLISPAPRLAVDRTGDGPLVVFLHGIDGNRTNWRDQLGVFAAHFTAAALDARGYGASDDYAGPLAFDDFAGDLRRVLDHYGARRGAGRSPAALREHGRAPQGVVPQIARGDGPPGHGRQPRRDRRADALRRGRARPADNDRAGPDDGCRGARRRADGHSGRG